MGSDTFTVERRATMNADPSAIYERLADFHKWQSWSPWDGLDPDQDRTYSGAEAGVGAAYAWSGNRKVGQGSMEITAADQDKRVEIALEFIKPFKSSNTTTFTLEPAGEGTTVVWSMTGPSTLMTKVMGIFKSMDKMVGPDFEKGLAALRTEVESA